MESGGEYRPIEERRADGVRKRQALPPGSHGAFIGERGDPLALIEAQNATRSPALVPHRIGRMARSPFAFLRGAAAVMADDLSRQPSSGVLTQACGDAHLSNFGIFGTPERRLAFDLNDFDETARAPFEWDVKRLAASVVVAGRANGLDEQECAAAAREAVRGYRERTAELADLPLLDVWHRHIDLDNAVAEQTEGGAYATLVSAGARAAGEARNRTNRSTLDKACERTADGWLFRHDPPSMLRMDAVPGEAAEIATLFRSYVATLPPEHALLLRHYRLADVIRRVSGIGSVGKRGYAILLLGEHADDSIFLQVKQAQPSVLESYTEASPFSSPAQRVVVGQRLLQAASDEFLGWMKEPASNGDRFYVRQLRDFKGEFEVGDMHAEELTTYAAVCGLVLAGAHARAGSAVEIAAYLGGDPAFDEAVGDYARAYADLNDADHAALVAAVSSGRLPSAG